MNQPPFKPAIEGNNTDELELTIKAPAEKMREIMDRITADEVEPTELEGDCGCDDTSIADQMQIQQGEIIGAFAMEGVEELAEGCGADDCSCDIAGCKCDGSNDDCNCTMNEGVVNKLTKAATGARMGAAGGPVGAAVGAAVGFGVATVQDKELEESSHSKMSSKDLQTMLGNKSSADYKVLDSEYMGKHQNHDLYEVLCSSETEGGMPLYTIRDLLIKNGKISSGTVDYSNASLSKAMDRFDMHVANVRQGLEEEATNDEMVGTISIEELKLSDRWARNPSTLDSIPSKNSIKVSQLDPRIEILFSDDVFKNRIESHDKISHKTFISQMNDIFILELDDEAFLIKTDGHDYIRYAIRLIDDTPEDDIHADLQRMKQLSGQAAQAPSQAVVKEVPFMGEDDSADAEMWTPNDYDDETDSAANEEHEGATPDLWAIDPFDVEKKNDEVDDEADDEDESFWNTPDDPTDVDHDQDFGNRGHTTGSNKEVGNSGDNPLPAPTEKETAFVEEAAAIEADLLEAWNVYEETKATSGYLNKKLRSEKEAKADIKKNKDDVKKAQAKNKEK